MRVGSVLLRRGWVLGILLLLWAGAAGAQGQAADTVQAAASPDQAATGVATGDTALAPAAQTAPPPETTPTEPPPVQEAAKKPSAVIEFFRKGGVFMWPLLIISVVGLAAIIERFITLQRASTNTKRFIGRIIDDLRTNGIRSAIETCQSTRGPIAAIIHSGLTKADQGPAAVEKAIEAAGGIEVSFLQRGLMIMATVANIAPLLGFLGTVSGMINAFEAIAQAEQVSAKLVASGISEALITTMTGLCIAIPVQMFHNYFVARIDRFIIEMEESSLDLVNELEAGNVNP
jgi:biopolymer transport protein ExbB